MSAIEIRDATGSLIQLERPLRRVVSLVPSVTETLFDLGVGEVVVGITDYCIFPDDPDPGLPRLGGTKNPDIDRIRELKPDLVHMNIEENLPRHAREIETFAPVFASEPKNVDDVERLIRALGLIHDAGTSAEKWVDRIGGLRKQGETRERFTFACAIWKDPWMWCGGDTYVSGLVETVGGRNVLAAEERYPRKTVDELLSLSPDRIYLPDEPWEFGEDDAELLRNRGFVMVKGPFPGHFFTWHGTRTIKGLEFLLSA